MPALGFSCILLFCFVLFLLGCFFFNEARDAENLILLLSVNKISKNRLKLFPTFASVLYLFAF